METKMNHYPEVKPKDKQLCLINNGISVQPARYEADQDQFFRYADQGPGDRIYRFYYAGVIGWWPFPEIPKETQFVAEQEKPVQREPDIVIDNEKGPE